MPMQPSRRTRLRLVRAACLGAWGVVTALLLLPNPASMVGLRSVPFSGYSAIAHFACFFLLATLTLASRLPVSRQATLGVLLAYGLAVELLQGFVPPRTVEFGDFVANTLGVAAGAMAYAAAERYRQRRTRERG